MIKTLFDIYEKMGCQGSKSKDQTPMKKEQSMVEKKNSQREERHKDITKTILVPIKEEFKRE